MTKSTIIALFPLWATLLASVPGCLPDLGTRSIEHAPASSVVSWKPATRRTAQGIHGAALDAVAVRPGDIVRLQVERLDAISIGERSREGTVERWFVVHPTDEVVIVRAGEATHTIVAAAGAIRRAWVGRTTDPGYGWFALEARALAWAKGPLGAPFPELSHSEVLNDARFSVLDRALQRDVAQSAKPTSIEEATKAVRAVLALRVVRELRPLGGLPYFQRSSPQLSGAAQAKSGRSGFALKPTRAASLSLDGPGLLEFSSSVAADASGPIALWVSESARERGRVDTDLRARTKTKTAGRASARRELPRLRLHVPPGHHDYQVIASGPLEVTTKFARPVVHLEDVAEKDEQQLLSVAERSCESAPRSSVCALALALLGHEDDARFARTAPEARHLAEGLARSPLLRPIAQLEQLASRGDPQALEQASEGVRQSIDQASQRAWSGSLSRGSHWTVASSERSDTTWSAVLGDTDAPECRGAQWQELTAQPRDLPSVRWHGAATLELRVAAPCNDPTPIELLVDGQRLVANPSSARGRWHIRVRGEQAKVARLDRGLAHVYTEKPHGSQCPARWVDIRAPHSLSSPVNLAFDRGGSAGVEIWLREGAKIADVRLRSLEKGSPRHALRITARPTGDDFTALDANAVRWIRVARAALPDWAKGGVLAEGNPDVAVRALVRVPRRVAEQTVLQPAEANAPTPPDDEDTLIRLSKQIQEASANDAGELYLRRGLLLAQRGATRGALSDARAAERLGVRGTDGELPSVLVSRAVRHSHSQPDPLPSGVEAFGIEPDFDPGAQRCVSGAGPRESFQRLWERLKTRAQEREPRYDVELAARALTTARATLDPRARTLLAWSRRGSRYRQIRGNGLVLKRHEKSQSAKRQGPVDGWGELRPRVASGKALEDGTFVIAVAGKPARARLIGIPAGAHMTLDVLCYAKEPALADEACAPKVELEGQAPVHPAIGGVTQSLSFAFGRRHQAQVSVTVASSPARWVVLARVRFDRAIPGAREVPGLGWVLAPEPHEYRFDLHPGRAVTLPAQATTLVRVNGYAESGTPHLVAEVGARTRVLPADGSPEVFALQAGTPLKLSVEGGTASVAAFERVPQTSDETVPAPHRVVPPRPGRETTESVAVAAEFQSASDRGSRWLKDAEQSPAPLTPVQSALGTVDARVGGVFSNVRHGMPVGTSNGYVFESISYRRRIERINLWTRSGVFSRQRTGEPTLGAEGSLYWKPPRTHLRLATAGSIETQRVAGVPSRTWEWRGFVEYSLRAASDLFLLPRVGWDTVDVSLRFHPSSLVEVDDDIYNPYRARRPTFLFGQALLWYAPHFNDVYYLRVRGSQDIKAGVFSHASLRQGAFVVFGAFDLGAFVDLTAYTAADSLDHEAHLRETVGASAAYDLWSALGSLDVEPRVVALTRPADGAYQVTAFLRLIGSYRRGLRDVPGFEIDFPEQRSGGVPWHGRGGSYP